MRRGAAHDGELLAEKLVTSHFTWIQSSGVFWVHFFGAIMISIGFWGPSYDIFNEEAAK